MAERAVFLDRDDTIIENAAYLGDPAKVKLLAGAAAALAALRALGYRLIVVSNQSGVARGMFDEAAVEAVNDEMSRQLKQQAGAYIDASYYCPYHPEAPIAAYRVDHDWRKPKPGMLKQAAADFGLDLSQCWMIGDMDRDIAAGAAVGCRTILLRDTEKKSSARGGAGEKGANGEKERMMGVSPNFVVRSLADAARIILREGRTLPGAGGGSPAAETGGGSGAAGGTGGATSVAVEKAVAPAPSLQRQEARSRESGNGGGPAAGQGSAGGAVMHAVDENAVAERVAEQLARSMPVWLHTGAGGGGNVGGSGGVSQQVEKNLDELVLQLRAQNRNAELKPDFSLAHVAAIVVQALAVVTLVIGLANHFTARATFADPTTAKGLSDQFFAMMAHEQAVFWGTVAVALEGMVIALLMYARGK